jgi:predicted ATP-dependent endonuclease of OLD family
MVFIGPQASGKSTVVKSIYFFKSIRLDVIRYLLESFESGEFNKPLGQIGKLMRQKFLDMWGSTLPLHPDMLLKYDYQPDVHISVTLTPIDKFANPQFSSYFEQRIIDTVQKCRNFLFKYPSRGANGFLSEADKIIRDTERASFKTNLVREINALFAEEEQVVFIPAGRTALTVLSEELMNFEKKKVDRLLKEFAAQINEIKPLFQQQLSRLMTEQERTSKSKLNTSAAKKAREKIRRILKGEYRLERGEERIYFSEEKYVKLNYASSGQQESVWILLLIFIQVLYSNKTFVVIEEPEAHLFPDAQKEMVDLIALLGNAQQGNKVVITTHSPYILTSLNNLLYAYEVGKTDPQNVLEVVDKASWLNPSTTAAYFVENGRLEPIMSNGLIQAERIDEISNKINTQLDQLYDLQPA